jgi:hypothetical protein
MTAGGISGRAQPYDEYIGTHAARSPNRTQLRFTGCRGGYRASMTFRAKETAQSTVRAINELVGEATDRIEDVLPKMDNLPKKIENVLPKRRKRSARRRTIGALLAAGVAAAIAFFALKSRRQTTPADASSASERTSTGSAGRRSDTVSDFDRDREPAVSHN